MEHEIRYVKGKVASCTYPINKGCIYGLCSFADNCEIRLERKKQQVIELYTNPKYNIRIYKHSNGHYEFYMESGGYTVIKIFESIKELAKVAGGIVDVCIANGVSANDIIYHR